ncbi:hypothetical protein Taro_024363 [Colocasia esculenta]|uniref:SnoaL-like domain-containing protein n=1 Tax=Colocasia esculenta TaxID=4460 RepID=A0A843V661_COLES|nr:hypothetical protein [Colocasia esculenta]
MELWWSCSTTLPAKPAVPSFPLHPPPLFSISPFPSNALPTPLPPKPSASISTCRRGGKWSTSPGSGPVPVISVLKRCRSLGGTAMASSSPPPPPASTTAHSVTTTAATVVRDFYDGINRRDLASVAPLISEACVYEDLVFSAPFVGRKVD